MITIPYTKNGVDGIGGRYYRRHVFAIGDEPCPSYTEWVQLQGGEFNFGPSGTKLAAAVIEFKNEADAVAFKLKYV